jgi:hypothetical protein
MFEYDKIALKSLDVFEDREESISSTRIATGHCRSTNFLPGVTVGDMSPTPLRHKPTSKANLYLSISPSPPPALQIAPSR